MTKSLFLDEEHAHQHFEKTLGYLNASSMQTTEINNNSNSLPGTWIYTIKSISSWFKIGIAFLHTENKWQNIGSLSIYTSSFFFTLPF